ncbi:hypothetical protein [Streptomyces spiramenti]|uniref:hypothetical protein n=1 Tax=Streptomyces spiramenti TaxID=2720606 RepID=UPI003083F644
MSAATELDSPALIWMPTQAADDEPAKHAAPELWDTGELDLSALTDPDSGLDGSSSRSGVAAPLTSEPPLADTTPLTAEQPLAAQLPLTAEPTGTALQGDFRGDQETTGGAGVTGVTGIE